MLARIDLLRERQGKGTISKISTSYLLRGSVLSKKAEISPAIPEPTTATFLRAGSCAADMVKKMSSRLTSDGRKRKEVLINSARHGGRVGSKESISRICQGLAFTLDNYATSVNPLRPTLLAAEPVATQTTNIANASESKRTSLLGLGDSRFHIWDLPRSIYRFRKRIERPSHAVK